MIIDDDKNTFYSCSLHHSAGTMLIFSSMSQSMSPLPRPFQNCGLGSPVE